MALTKTEILPKYITTRRLILCALILMLLTACQGSEPGNHTDNGRIITSSPGIQSTEQTSIPSQTAPVASLTVTPKQSTGSFSGQRALEDAKYQIDLGPRTVGSAAHQKAGDLIMQELENAGWKVEVQETSFKGKPVRNIIGKLQLNAGKDKPWVILGAHYDSRLIADKDPDIQKRSQPVPGADDGASGVAVLLELARTLPEAFRTQTISLPRANNLWLVFIDNEDNGNIPGWDWLMGSQAFVQSLDQKPDAALILDMIGDKNLNIKFEANSNQIINQEIWSQAARLGYSEQFQDRLGFSMIDDHTPFLQAGIPAVDIIDFDYPYYHTTADTLDKISAASLQAVGDTVTAWLTDGSSIFKTSP